MGATSGENQHTIDHPRRIKRVVIHLTPREHAALLIHEAATGMHRADTIRQALMDHLGADLLRMAERLPLDDPEKVNA